MSNKHVSLRTIMGHILMSFRWGQRRPFPRLPLCCATGFELRTWFNYSTPLLRNYAFTVYISRDIVIFDLLTLNAHHVSNATSSRAQSSNAYDWQH